MDLSSLNDVPPHHQPYPFWFWNGAMDAAEIRRQLAIMREAGITEFIIHGRTGLRTPFLSDAWFDAVKAAVEDAAANDMRVWIYDEYNWPSGTANGTITADPRKREHFRRPDGSLQPIDHPEIGPRSVDYLNPDCTREFIVKCYQPYHDRFARYFGNTIAGFFNDEARLASPYPWSPAMKGPPPAPAEYYRCLGELIVRNHFKLIRDWCEARGVQFTGHVMGEETLGSGTRYMGDLWSTVSCYHQSGVDHLGPAAHGQHPWIPDSIARLGGSRLLTAEAFAGCPWEMSPRDLYRLGGWLYANGVTRLILHGFFYTREGPAATDWPPDLFFRWSGWSGMRDFICWAGRVQHFLARAQPCVRVALYHPLEEFQREFIPHPDFMLNYTDAAEVLNDRARAMHLNFGELMNSMIRRGIDFDVVPRQLLDRVNDRPLVVPSGPQPQFKGKTVAQGNRSPDDCIVELDRLLGRRVKVTGANSAPRPHPVSPRLSDPYLHEGKDDGGVWLREFTFEGRPAVLLWNANATDFTGTCDLVEKHRWSVWTPSDGKLESRGTADRIEVSLPAHNLAIALESLSSRI
jgi:hypothetical protein